ncbi:MAG: hypothetical protein PQJ50_06865 [Spirochaetales bacterium]|nr:hypothetical protein [Spirochaetales bacterium]
MKKYIYLCLLFTIVHSLSALQWPAASESMTTSFLEERDGMVQAGLVFENYDTMRPFDNGETVFRYSPEAYSALPGSGDSLLVLGHENGFQSIYAGITPAETRADRNRISAGEFLKAPSESEESEETGFCRFFIRDALLDQIVNPLVLLPLPPDTRSPRLLSVLLIDGDNSFELMGQKEDLIVPVGNYMVYVRSEDFTNRGVRQMPYTYSLYNLGTLLLERQLDAVQQSGGSRVFQDGSPLDSVFTLSGYLFLGDIVMTSGRSVVEISLADVHGNESSESFDIGVTR